MLSLKLFDPEQNLEKFADPAIVVLKQPFSC